MSALRSNIGMSVYSATKASISGILKSLSKELVAYNTRINSVLLGAVKTEMHLRITKNYNEKMLENYNKKHILGFGKVQNVTPFLIYLLTDASSWSTGSELVLDGGLLVN